VPGETWDVVNSEVLKRHVGHRVEVSGNADCGKHLIQVFGVERVDSITKIISKETIALADPPTGVINPKRIFGKEAIALANPSNTDAQAKGLSVSSFAWTAFAIGLGILIIS
jgi:hypothetical protein